MRISDWSSDVCSSDLVGLGQLRGSRDRMPVATHVLAHVGARPDTHQRFVLGLRDHGSLSPLIFLGSYLLCKGESRRRAASFRRVAYEIVRGQVWSKDPKRCGRAEESRVGQEWGSA